MRLWFRKRGGGFLGFFVRLLASKYSHCEVQFTSGISFSANIGEGTRYKQIDYKPAEWDCLDVPADDDQEDAMRALADLLCGAGYDLSGVLAHKSSPVAPAFKQDEKKWFCSEVCTKLMQVAGYVEKLKPAQTSPARLYNAWRKELKALRKAQATTGTTT